MENVSAMAPDYGRSIAGLPNLESVESVAEWLKVDAGRDDLPAVLPMGLIASYASELEQRSASLAALLVDAAAYEINRGSVIVAETEEGLLEELRDVVRPRRYVEIMAEGESLRGAFMVDIDDHPRLLDEFEAIKVFGQQVKEHLRREVRRD